MASRTLPNIGLTAYWPLGDDAWKDGMDANLFALTILGQLVAESFVTGLPAPVEGKVVLSTGSNQIAIYENAAWKYITAKAGWLAWVKDPGGLYVFDGATTWNPVTTGGAGGGLPPGGIPGQALLKVGADDGDADWTDLPPGAPGSSAELRVSGGHVQWRQDDGSPDWTDLIALTALGFPTGGTAKQVLVKQSATDGDAIWETRTFKLPFFFTSPPLSNEVLSIIVADEDFTIPADFAGAQYTSVGVNPTATFVITLYDGVTAIATISIATTGVVTLATTGGVAKNVVAGSVLKFVAQATVDATLANVAVMLRGTV